MGSRSSHLQNNSPISNIAITIRQPIAHRPPLYWRLTSSNQITVEDHGHESSPVMFTFAIVIGDSGPTIRVAIRSGYSISNYKEGNKIYITPREYENGAGNVEYITYDPIIHDIEIEMPVRA